jgi:hypothetical protein
MIREGRGPERPSREYPLAARILDALKRPVPQSVETAIAGAEHPDASMRIGISIMPNREVALYSRVPSVKQNRWFPTDIQLFTTTADLFLQEQSLIDAGKFSKDIGFHGILSEYEPAFLSLERQSGTGAFSHGERIGPVAQLEIVETDVDASTLTRRGQHYRFGIEQDHEDGETTQTDFAFHVRKIDGFAYIIVQRGIHRGMVNNALRLIDKFEPKGLPAPPEQTDLLE